MTNTQADDRCTDVLPRRKSVVRYPKFELRMGPADREKLDLLAERLGQSRGAVIKTLLRNAEPPGGPGDMGTAANTVEATAAVLSDRT